MARQRYYEKINWKTGKKRLVQVRTILDPKRMPWHTEDASDHPFQEALSLLSPTYRLFWNREIERYVIYNLYNGKAHSNLWEVKLRSYKDMWMKVRVVDGPGLQYREPGEWLYWELRKKDATKGGALSIREAMKSVENKIDELDEAYIDGYYKYLDMMEAINKDFDKYVLKGRKPLPGGRKFVKKKVAVFVGARTGKVLGTAEMKNNA